MAKKKPNVKTAEELGVEIVSSMSLEFRNDSDRAVAVVGAAYLDSIIEQLLRAALLERHDDVESLLSPSGAIGANGARFKLAFCLSLIDEGQKDDLRIIAEVRNTFAHSFGVSSFEEDTIKDKLRNLHYFQRVEMVRRGALKGATSPDARHYLEGTAVRTSRELFQHAVTDLLISLISKIQDVRRSAPSMWYAKPIENQS